MLDGPLLKNVLLFSFPIMLSNLLQIAFNAADTVIVGRVPETYVNFTEARNGSK